MVQMHPELALTFLSYIQQRKIEILPQFKQQKQKGMVVAGYSGCLFLGSKLTEPFVKWVFDPMAWLHIVRPRGTWGKDKTGGAMV